MWIVERHKLISLQVTEEFDLTFDTKSPVYVTNPSITIAIISIGAYYSAYIIMQVAFIILPFTVFIRGALNV